MTGGLPCAAAWLTNKPVDVPAHAARRSVADVGFGDVLRQHRVAAGLTQEDLAERAGLSLRGVSDLERGVSLRDAQGVTRYRAAVDGNGDPTVHLFDAQGNVIWSAP